MKLKKLIKDIPISDVKGPKEIEITGICSNSRCVAPGNLFIAKKGIRSHGAVYIPEAISAGAVAVLTDIYDPTLKQITQVISQDVSSIEGEIAAKYHQYPSDELLTIGITGTNGKTTTAFLIKHLFDTLQAPCGLIGTIHYLIGNHRFEASHTTPDVATNQKLLREMVKEGCQSAIMEVTSHALDQGRVANVHFDVGIFTNLTPEHLDYHQSMEAYSDAKARLFGLLDPEKSKKKLFSKVAIVNGDDSYFDRMIQGCRVPVLSYGIEKEAHLKAEQVALSVEGASFVLQYDGRSYPVKLPLFGRYNIYNALAAIACGISQGISLEAMIQTVKTFPPVPGRLEPIPNDLGINVYVDFAHTPDALEHVLQCLNDFKLTRIITVFGCGGDRDRKKRPVMAEIAEKHSEITIVTSDNPRSEIPEKIIEEVVTGFQSSSKYQVEPDRRQAIELAIKMAQPNDFILIAGRGHEPFQVIGHQTIEFDDRVVAKEICENLAKKAITL